MSKDKALQTNIKDNSPPQKRKPRKITEKYLYNAGLHYLQRYTASSAHFKTVMGRKIKKSCAVHKDQTMEECLKLLDQITEQLTELGYLNDEAYIKGMVTSFRNRGLSGRAIQSKLLSKGIPTDKTAQVLKGYDEDRGSDPRTAETLAALTFCRKKRLGPFARDTKKTFEQAMGSLGRAGFNFETARLVLEMSKEEYEEYLNKQSNG